MSSGGDGGSRVSIPADLRKTIHTIREITGKQHTDEDIFAVLNDCFYDPYEAAQKLLYLDTFHEVRSKRDKKKEVLVPNTQGSGRSGRRNYSSSYTHPDAGNGRNGTFKRESGANHITGGSRPAFPPHNKARISRATKTSNGPIALSNGATNHKTRDDFTNTVNKQFAGEQPPRKSNYCSDDGVETDKTKANSDLVATPVSGSVVQNHTQDSLDENSAPTSKPIVNNQPSVSPSSSLNNQDPSSPAATSCNGQSVQVSKRDVVADKGKTQSTDVGERPHVTFPVHIQVAKALENGLTFGSFDCNVMKEASSNSSSIEDDHPDVVESSHGMGDNAAESSPTTDDIPEEAPSSQDLPTLAQDMDNDSSNSGHGAERAVSPVEGSKGDDIIIKEGLLNAGGTHQIPSVQNIQHNVFGFVPSFSAPGQPMNTGVVETQNANSKPQMLPYSTPTDQSSIAASQQAIHLFRQHYPPNFFPYGPYFPPLYMPHPYIHQFLIPNGLPQQSFLPPGAAAAAAASGMKVPFPQFKLGNNPGNPPPAAAPPPYGSSTVPFSHISAATAMNPIINKEDISIPQWKESVYTTGPPNESAAAWMAGQSLSNLQVSPMYNQALQVQPLAFPTMQAGHGGFPGIYQPAQPVAAAATPPSDQTLQLSSRTTPAMAETVGPPPMVYQQPQAAQPNWAASNY